MLIPKYLKTCSVTLYNALPEINRKTNYTDTYIDNVTLKGSYVNEENLSKALNSGIKDVLHITIDVKDVEKKYQPFWVFHLNPIGWTINPDKDYFDINGIKLEILSFKEINLVGRLRFVEVVCKRT